MRKAVGWILLVIAIAAAGVVSVGFSRNHADQRHAVAYVQSADVWQARQHLLWQEVDVARNAQVAQQERNLEACLLYTSDAADDLLCVDLGGRRIIKKK